MTQNEKAKDDTVAKDTQGVSSGSEEKKTEKGKTTSGMDENLAGMLGYIIFIGLFFLVTEKESRFVRYHSLQGIFTTIAITLFVIIINFIPILGLILTLLLSPVSIILFIFLMYQAYQGKWTKLPIVGQIAEDQAKNMSE